MPFGLSMRKILTLLGAGMMIFVVANVQFGAVAPRVIDGAEGQKLDALLMFEPSCSFSAVEEELRSTGSSYCLGQVGQWSGADILMLMEGLFLFVYGFELPQNKAWAKRLRKIGFIMGAVLCSLAVLDRLSILPTSASSEGLADLAPFPIQAWVVQILFAVIGVLLIRGQNIGRQKLLCKPEINLSAGEKKRGNSETPFSNLKKHDKKTLDRSSRSRFLQKDQNLVMSRRRSKLLVMATCPYCKGAGCSKCNQNGVF